MPTTKTRAKTTNLFLPWPKQRLALSLVLDEGVEQLLFGGSAGGGKSLDIHTPIPTPSGWRGIGDLVAGDTVFDERGHPTLVTHAFDPFLADSYRLTFDDGTTIDACADHQWLTFDAKELGQLTRRSPEWRAARRLRRPSRVSGRKSERFTRSLTLRNQTILAPPALPTPTGSVRTTAEIVATLRTHSGRANHAVPVAAPLDLPDVDLPLDPYILGAWLGDGTSSDGGMTTMDVEIEAAFAAAGFPFGEKQRRGRAWSASALGLYRVLRMQGVLGNKHVPAAYLRASREQRLALLQGLMDTDGTVTDSGKPEFTNTNKAIVDAAYELIVSLGWKARVVEGVAKLDGRYIGPKWDIKWSPDDYVFRLSRKRERQILATRRTTKFRYIVEASAIEPVMMRCISVANESHLYLAGRSMVPTHNSQTMRMLAASLAVKWPGSVVPIFRRTDMELQANHVTKWLVEVDAFVPAGRFFQQKMEYHWPSPPWCWCPKDGPCAHSSVTAFRHVDDNRGVLKYQGPEFAAELIDEATHFKGQDIDFLYTRIRAPEGAQHPQEIIGPDGRTYHYPGWPGYRPLQVMTANPGGVGHNYMRDNYIDPEGGLERLRTEAETGVTIPQSIKEVSPILHPTLGISRWKEMVTVRGEEQWAQVDMREGQQWTVDIDLGEMGHTSVRRAFVPSRVWDNPSLDPMKYAATLAVGSAETRKRLLDGDWSYSEDKVFKMLEKSIHLVDPARIFGAGQPPPDGWIRGIGLDHGSVKPAAATWMTVDEEGYLIAYREYYHPGSVKQHVESIREIMEWDGHMNLTLQADPQMWRLNQNVRGDVISVAALYAMGGEMPEDVDDAVARARHTGLSLAQSKITDAAALDAMLELLDLDPERLYPSWHTLAGQYGSPAMFFTTECPNLWRELTNLRRPKMEDDGMYGEGLKNGQPDHCLVGETLVDTLDGPRRIDSLTDGRVWGPDGGLHRFHGGRKTHSSVPVMKVTFADGRSVTGTPEHRFLMADGTWRHLSDLRTSDRVVDISVTVWQEVVSVEDAGVADTYNISVDDVYSFSIAGGIIVHNSFDATKRIAEPLRRAAASGAAHRSRVRTTFAYAGARR